jgi:hypothetical protein
MLGCADGVRALAGEKEQSAATGEPLYVPAGAKSPLDDLAYVGILLSRFWQDDYSNLVR